MGEINTTENSNQNIYDEELFADEIEEKDEERMFEHFRFEVDKGQSLVRIDKFLTTRIENASRNRVQNAIDAGNVLVNEQPVKSSYKVKPNDTIVIVMPYQRRSTEVIPENIPINIVYEDEDIMVINKEAGMVVHPGHGNYSGTLVNAVCYHLQQNGEKPVKDDERAGLLVHRIDKDTSGLLLIAKNEIAHNRLAKQFFDHTITRSYVALVWGRMEQTEGTIEGNIGRSLTDRLKMRVFPEGDHGKHAVTHYSLLEDFDYVSLVECRLETGRTHQIRVHMSHIGHPLFNDERYGGDRILRGTHFSKYKQFIENCFTILPRQALHAKVLGFVHPRTAKPMLFESAIPQDMDQAITKWRNYLSSRTTE